MRFVRNILTTLLFIAVTVSHGYAQNGMPSDTGHVPFDTAKYKAMVKFAFPNPIGYVNDFGHILDSTSIATLNTLITEHKDKTTDQLAVVTIDDYYPYDDISSYTVALSNKWGVGTKETNNGVVIVVCKPKREVRISTGTGIEKRLSDVACEEIIDYFIIPQFKKDNYSKGLIDAVKEIIRQLQKN